MIIGIQGGRGSFNELALQALQKRGDLEPTAEPRHLFTTRATLEAVQNSSVDYGIFAIYNSKSQLVAESARVIGHYHFDVVSSITIPIQHHLMVDSAVDPIDITTLMGHEEALTQCKYTLKRRFENVAISSGEGDLKDGAGVAQAINQGILPVTTAVLGSQATATAFDLKVIASDLADDPRNATTFLLVQNYKTS